MQNTKGFKHYSLWGAYAGVPSRMKKLEFYFVRYGEHRQVQASTAVIEVMLHVRWNAIGTFIQDYETGPVIKPWLGMAGRGCFCLRGTFSFQQSHLTKLAQKQSCKCQPLLLTRWKVFLPVSNIIQARPDDVPLVIEFKLCSAVMNDSRRDMRPAQANANVFISSPRGQHFCMRLRVNNQVPQRTIGDKVHLPGRARQTRFNMVLCKLLFPGWRCSVSINNWALFRQFFKAYPALKREKFPWKYPNHLRASH